MNGSLIWGVEGVVWAHLLAPNATSVDPSNQISHSLIYKSQDNVPLIS